MFEKTGENLGELIAAAAPVNRNLFDGVRLFHLPDDTVTIEKGERTFMKLTSKSSDRTIEQILRLMRSDESFDAPPDAIRGAKNIFRSRLSAPKKSAVEKVLAVLQINLPAHRAIFGERSATGARAGQMLFQAGENALDIRIAETDRGFNLHGQILGGDFAGGTLRLGEFETVVNELGEFKLTEVPGGNYRLSVRKNQKEIVVENLEFE